MKLKATVLAGFVGVAIGISAVAGVAACSPDAPAPTPAKTTTPVTHDGVTQGGGIGATYDPKEGLWSYSVGPCRDESDQGCYWDASIMGGDKGRSFVNLGGVKFYADGGK